MIRPGDLDAVHEGGLRLLAETGTVFHDLGALGVFRRHGFTVDGLRVVIPPSAVADALATAPSRFTLVGRRPELDLEFGDGTPVLGTASCCAFVLEGDVSRPGTLADVETVVRLDQVSPYVQISGYAVEPLDLPVEQRYKRALHLYLTLSDKAPEYRMGTLEDLTVATDTAEILYGARWAERPRLLTVLNSTSPLVYSAETAAPLVRMAELGQPVCVTPNAMAGATAPATLAGTLALQHAEVLAGLVLSQLVRPGCPFLYGGTSSLISMVSGAMMTGVPEFWSLMEGTVQLAHHLGLPCRAGGGLTDAYLPDMQAGIESAMGLSTVLRLGVDFVLQAVGILGSFNLFSFEKYVADEEVWGMLLDALVPIAVDEETLAIEVTAGVGPGGGFLTDDHTYRHCRDHARTSCFNRRNEEGWKERGALELREAARQRLDERLAAYVEPELDAVTRRQLEVYCLA